MASDVAIPNKFNLYEILRFALKGRGGLLRCARKDKMNRFVSSIENGLAKAKGISP